MAVSKYCAFSTSKLLDSNYVWFNCHSEPSYLCNWSFKYGTFYKHSHSKILISIMIWKVIFKKKILKIFQTPIFFHRCQNTRGCCCSSKSYRTECGWKWSHLIDQQFWSSQSWAFPEYNRRKSSLSFHDKYSWTDQSISGKFFTDYFATPPFFLNTYECC